MGNNYINKLLWFLFGVGLGLCVSTFKAVFISEETDKTRNVVLLTIGVLIVLVVSACWSFSDFWV